ncbi:MAG: hypothetical protein NTU80_11810 [Verrucomicrobia bacterium]|nr:hypothetical protein [Verrucomicrobiota bacterium]
MPVPATRATTPATLPPLEERLRLARELVTTPRWRALCFWNWPEPIEVTKERLPATGGALRLYGGKPGFLLAAKLCRSIHFRRVF